MLSARMVRPQGHAHAEDWGPLGLVRTWLDALDRHGKPWSVEASGFFARVIQHEYDHLIGMMFLDRMKSLETLTFLEEYGRYWARHEEDE